MSKAMLRIRIQLHDSALWAGLLAGAVCLALAYGNLFVQDDAYISFRYARNFAEGLGLVWQKGSTEYGYTSFLFTLLIGLLLKAGMAAEEASYLLSFSGYLAALILIAVMSQQLGTSRFRSSMVMLAAGGSYSVAAYASGGLETSFALSMVLATLVSGFAYRSQPSSARAAWVGAACAVALLTRLDSSLLLLPCGLYVVVAVVSARRYRDLAVMAAIPTVLVGGQFWFCAAMYDGYWLPNTFYAKGPLNEATYAAGFAYLKTFMYMERWLCAVPLALAAGCAVVSRRFHRKGMEAAVLVASSLLWLFYVVRIGGDFMEFRLLVPPIVLLLLWSLTTIQKQTLFAACLACLAVAHWFHATTPQEKLGDTVAPIAGLRNFVAEQPWSWVKVGKLLNRLFYTGGDDDPVIAVTAAGAIPYFSRLPAIDLHGLNSRSMIRHEFFSPTARPGHRYGYWLDVTNGANILLGHPQIIKKDELVQTTGHCGSGLPPGATCKIRAYDALNCRYLIAMGGEYDLYLVVKYMRHHPKVDKLIAEGRIEASPCDPTRPEI